MTRPPAWFRLLLALLPVPLRERHREEICDLAALYARDRSLPGRTFVWLRAALDLVGVALQSRLEQHRGARSSLSAPGRLGFLAGWGRDVRYGLRGLRHDAAFTVFAVLIVGLGIGASATVFSVAQALLLRPLPFAEPERLVWISNGDFGRGQQQSEITVQVGHVVKLRNEATQLDDVGGYHFFDRDGDHTLMTRSEPVRVTRLRVTQNFLSVLGVEPEHGRFFSAEEAWDDGPGAIVLTHASFRRHFQGDVGVVGTPVNLDGRPATVIGVLPRSFDFSSIFSPGKPIDYLAPYPLSERSHRSGNTLGLIGRLADGATIETARAEIASFAVPEEQTGERENSFHPMIRPLREHLSGSFRPAMALLAGAVGLVMLMVCANLSNLLLARGAMRRRELAIRAALGAHRTQLLRQLLTESILLSAGGTLLGVFIASRATAVVGSLDLRIPMLADLRVDAPVLTVAVAAALAVGLLFGVVPALRGSRVHLDETLRDGARGVSIGRGTATLRRALVVAQVAIATLLLIASTLTARSLANLIETDLGYEADGAVAMRIDPSQRFASNEERLGYYGSVLDRMRGVPGITAAGLSDILPMAFNRRWDARAMEIDTENRVFPYVRVVSDGYLGAMGLSLVAGRDFTATDGPDEPLVTIINEQLATLLFGERDPVGYRVRSSSNEHLVIGVVRPTRQLSVDQEPGPEIFFTLRQIGDHAAVHLVLRADRPLAGIVDAARDELRSIDASVPLDRTVRIRDVVDTSLASRRFLVVLLSLFAGFALALAALGIYAVIAYSVSHRRQEIGIHIALGATSGAVQRRLSRESVSLTALGLGIGVALGGLFGRALESFLFGIAALDPLTYVATTVFLGAVALVAGWVPVRRASRRNPLDALHGIGSGS